MGYESSIRLEPDPWEDATNPLPSIQPPYVDSTRGAWVLTRYQDVRAALGEAHLVITGARCGPDRSSGSKLDDALPSRLGQEAQDLLSPTGPTRWGASLEPLAHRMLDRLLEAKRPADLVRDFAEPWSLAVAIMVTEPAADGQRLAALARDVFAAAAEPQDAVSGSRAEWATLELARSFQGKIPWLRVQAFVALSQTLPCFLGNAWLALLQHPAEMSLLRQHPRMTSRAMEELLRFAGPAHAQFRRAVAGVQIGGATMARGDRAILMLAAANRDPALFPDPNRLDLRRRIPGHLALGGGVHRCVGALLVRLAATAATRVLLERWGTAERTGHAEWRGGFAIRALASLPVVLGPASGRQKSGGSSRQRE